MTNQRKPSREMEKPSLPLALAPLVITIALVALQVFYYEDASPHVPLMIGVLVTAGFG